MTGELSVRTVVPPEGSASAPWAVAERAGAVDGYARVRPDGDLELLLGDTVGDPVARAVALVGRLAADTGRAPVRWWVPGAGRRDREVAAALGLAATRELCHMQVPLPLPHPVDLDWRPFVPGQDEAAWLAVNNRAFATHRDQGDQTLDRLLALEAEPWFDPAGFVLHERDDRLVGFCWTKVHAGLDPPVGEIFVIGVDPSAHGLGLGRALVLAGLEHLHGRGLTKGMLYVDEDNTPAMALYRSLGFVTTARDVEFTAVADQPVDTPADGRGASPPPPAPPATSDTPPGDLLHP